MRINKIKENKVLIISDTHVPFEREHYLEHCINIQKKYKCNKIIHIGDLVDNNFSSYHEINPDGHSAGDELRISINRLKDWKKAFPKVDVCTGNHCAIIQRKALTSGLSKRWVRGLNEVLELPEWSWEMSHKIDGVLYTHGNNTSGNMAAFNQALHKRCSIVAGHIHTVANIMWNVSEIDRIFSMQVGCGVDDKQYAFAYAKDNIKKSIISCAVVLENGALPILELMNL